MFISPVTVLDHCAKYIPAWDSGLNIADCGCGLGEYTIELAKRMNNQGRLFAVDIQKPLLERVSVEAAARKYNNLITIWSDLELLGATRIPESSLDMVILSNILFQAEDKATVIQEAFRLLKSGGKLLVVDWLDSFSGLGPQKSDVLPVDSARQYIENNGFTINTNVDGSNHHYVILSSKP